jgi:hypothetical protein
MPAPSKADLRHSEEEAFERDYQLMRGEGRELYRALNKRERMVARYVFEGRYNRLEIFEMAWPESKISHHRAKYKKIEAVLADSRVWEYMKWLRDMKEANGEVPMNERAIKEALVEIAKDRARPARDRIAAIREINRMNGIGDGDDMKNPVLSINIVSKLPDTTGLPSDYGDDD